MKPHYIHKLIAQGEHQTLDFKFEISDAKKIARTFVAFANARGGKLLIGVNDDGTIAGTKSPEELFMAEKAGNLYCKPPLKVQIKEWNVEGKKVLEIKIAESESKPHSAPNEQDQWRVYIRVNDQNLLANRIIVSAFHKKSRNEGTYIEYTENEKKLLTYLQEHESISEEEFVRLAFINKNKASVIISNMIAIGILDFSIKDNHFVYQLNPEFSKIK
jgi:predicted HTH transcriptional regulator